MSGEADQVVEVILVVAEAELVSDLQQEFVPRGLTVRYAETPAQAREVCESVRPRLVVAPIDGAPGELLKAWSQSAPPADVVIGLLESLEDAERAPKCVKRTVRKGQARELVSLADLLLRSVPAGSTLGGGQAAESAGSLWDKPGGVLANAQEKIDAQDADAEEADIDPGRVSDIRGLAMAVSMAKTMGKDSGPAEPSPGASIRLRHGAGAETDPGLTPAEGLRVSDALAELPEARAAVGHTEKMKALADQAPALDSAPEPAAKKKKKKKKGAEVVLGKIGARRKSRKGLVIGLVTVLVLGGAFAGVWFFYLRPKPPPRPRWKEVPTVVAVPKADPRGGALVDAFAGTIARLPKVVTAVDVDFLDEQLHLSVPELNPFLEKSLARLSSKKRRAVLLERGTKLLSFERYPEARRYLHRAVKLRDGPKARAALARAYAGLGRYWAAVAHCKVAIRKDRKNATLRADLGRFLMAQGKKKKACRAFRRAAKLDPKLAKLMEQNCGGKR